MSELPTSLAYPAPLDSSPSPLVAPPAPLVASPALASALSATNALVLASEQANTTNFSIEEDEEDAPHPVQVVAPAAASAELDAAPGLMSAPVLPTEASAPHVSVSFEHPSTSARTLVVLSEASSRVIEVGKHAAAAAIASAKATATLVGDAVRRRSHPSISGSTVTTATELPDEGTGSSPAADTDTSTMQGRALRAARTIGTQVQLAAAVVSERAKGAADAARPKIVEASRVVRERAGTAAAALSERAHEARVKAAPAMHHAAEVVGVKTRAAVRFGGAFLKSTSLALSGAVRRASAGGSISSAYSQHQESSSGEKNESGEQSEASTYNVGPEISAPSVAAESVPVAVESPTTAV
jgi:hypothetical protein